MSYRDMSHNDMLPHVIYAVKTFSCLDAELPACEEEIWLGTREKLAGPLAARSPGLWLAVALEIERHRGADEILQSRLIEPVAFVDIDGAPDIPAEDGVKQTGRVLQRRSPWQMSF
jgi:hypothetical protein